MTIKRNLLGLLRQAEKNSSILHKASLAVVNDKLATPTLLSEENVPHDTICVNDISGSMAWKDCKPSRLEASKMASQKFISKRAALSSSDRIAVVSFDTHGRIVLPFTKISELSSINAAIESLKVEGGTDIAQGLKVAAGIFADENISNFSARRLKRVLLLTDGCGGSPIEISRALKEAGVLIEVIGIGGCRLEVNEKLLKKVATTDSTGFTHYWFMTDTDNLVKHYEKMATGIIWKGSDQ